MKLPRLGKATINGFFSYIDVDNWNTAFSIVDDDGQPFALDELREFDRKEVRVTIELIEPTSNPERTLSVDPD